MDIVEQLIRDEGLRLKPYRDSVGKLTIGIGRNLDDVGITQEEACYLLHTDIVRVAGQIQEALPWANNLSPARASVLGNMAFNMGIGGLLQFKQFLAALEAGDYEKAATEMLNSKWAKQVGPRADRLAQQIRTGQWT